MNVNDQAALIASQAKRITALERAISNLPASVGGGGGYSYITDTAPLSATVGEMWFDTGTGASYIWYDGYWVQVSPGGANAGEAAPVGAVLPYAGATAPTGWFICNGQAISRTQYDALFAAIGTVWGTGDGSTTFNVPDLRGRVPVGKSASGTFATLGGTAGAETHTLTTAEMPNHGHNFGLGVRQNSTPNPTNPGICLTGNNFGTDYSTLLSIYSGATEGSGSGNAHNNIQPSAVVNYIIRADATSGSGSGDATAWTAVTFQNSWVNYGGNEQVTQYRKLGDMVQVRGHIKNGTNQTVAFTLPPGFRQPAYMNYPVANWSGTVPQPGFMVVHSDGEHIPYVTSVGDVSFFIEYSIST